MQWPLAEAKQKFSEVIQHALDDGPQFISKRGTETAVVLSVGEYKQLKAEHDMNLKDYILSGPSLESIDITRNKSAAPMIEL